MNIDFLYQSIEIDKEKKLCPIAIDNDFLQTVIDDSIEVQHLHDVVRRVLLSHSVLILGTKH